MGLSDILAMKNNKKLKEVTSQLSEVATKTVKQVNDTLPDENGNVNIEIPDPDLSNYATKNDLSDKVSTVNGQTPDENGNVTIEVPEVDTSKLITKEELGNQMFIRGIVSETEPINPTEGTIWFQIINDNELSIPTDYLFRFDASELDIADNSKVSQWNDLSANGNNLVQATDSLRPIFSLTGLNEKPTVQFDNSELSDTSFTLPNIEASSLFIVCQAESITSASIMTIGVLGTVDMIFGVRMSGSGKTAGIRINGTQTAATVPVDINPFLGTYTWDKQNYVIAYKNGNEVSAHSYANDIMPHDCLRLGDSLTTSAPEPFFGKISEVIYFDRILADEERILVENYLIQKWGL